MQAQIGQRLRDPITWAEASQLAKTVGAAVVAWVLAVHVFHLSQAFMAPWAALLTVHATVFGTVQRGAQQAGASVLGVLIASGAWQLFGGGALALGASVLAGMLAGAAPGLRAPMTTATTAVVVLTTGYVGNSGMLADRLIDTGIGIAVGLLVNLLVWPPLRDRAAARHIDVIDDRLGELLTEIAAELRDGCATEAADDWIAQTDRLDDDLDRAWHVLEEARQSGRLNPRRAVPERMRAAEEMTQVINRLAQAVAETRSMARTIRVASARPGGLGARVPRAVAGAAGACGHGHRACRRRRAQVRPRRAHRAVRSPGHRSRSTAASGRCSARCSSTCAMCSTRWTSSPRPNRCRCRRPRWRGGA